MDTATPVIVTIPAAMRQVARARPRSRRNFPLWPSRPIPPTIPGVSANKWL
jgi:hypothetical protein